LPILPIVDLLILMGTLSLVVGFFLKAITLATIENWTILGFSSTDFVLIAGICFGMAMMLVARTWLKLNEPHVLSIHRRLSEEAAHRRAVEIEQLRANGVAPPEGDAS
jgi:hypothetical protein